MMIDIQELIGMNDLDLLHYMTQLRTEHISYDDYLESKIEVQEDIGFHVELDELSDDLKLFNKIGVQWMLGKGRALLSASFGLHKTRMQIEVCRQVYLKTGGKTLIVCPLGVKHQFQEEDGPTMGTRWQYVTSDAEIEFSETPYLITNYERIREGNIDPTKHNFAVVSLDEGSILRSLGSKTYDVFERLFKNVPYRFVATATAAPNEYKEIIYYARYLGVMDVGQALTRWFKRDSQKAGHLTIHPHHEKDFWLWVASWALFIFKPSDLTENEADDIGYNLPKMNVIWHRVPVDHTRAWGQVDNHGQARLFLDAANGVSEASQEKRATMQARLDYMTKEIMTPDNWLIWHDLEDERRLIEKEIPDAVTVFGSQALEKREERILGFSRGQFRILATKPSIAGSGCNFQKHCNNAVFLGVGYKFQDFIQAVFRINRFGQDKLVNIHIIAAESEDTVVSVLKRKWKQYDVLMRKMQKIVKKYGLKSEALKGELKRKIGLPRLVQSGELFTLVNNDSVRELPLMESDSIGLVHTSIPFGNHYEYTTQLEDLGHNPTNDSFWRQMDYMIPELLRVTMPGRVAAIHVKDRVLYGHQTASGFLEIAPFSDECVTAFRKHGWMYEGRRTISTDVVSENNQTYRLGWTEMSKDASKMGSGSPEYLLLFRKPPSNSNTARADEPVVKNKDDYTRGRWQIDAAAEWRSSGDRLLLPDEYANMYDLGHVAAVFRHEQENGIYDHERHVAITEAIDERGHLPSIYALLPVKITRDETDWVWDDIMRMRVLNAEQSKKRLENHVCPLPLDIVARTIRLYSNPGDTILDPFGGLMSVPYKAIEMGRKAYAIELFDEYFEYGTKYCREMEQKVKTPTLFDYLAKKLEEVEA